MRMGGISVKKIWGFNYNTTGTKLYVDKIRVIANELDRFDEKIKVPNMWTSQILLGSN